MRFAIQYLSPCLHLDLLKVCRKPTSNSRVSTAAYLAFARRLWVYTGNWSATGDDRLEGRVGALLIS
jgi:hypothetical protein